MLLVQCDFDDTITVGNVSTAIHELFGPDDWVQMEKEYHDGKFTVEESNIRQYGLIRATRQDIEDFVVGEVVLRFAFDEFVDHCHGEGIKLVVVSSGLDLYIKPALETMGFEDLDVYSGSAQVTDEGIVVSYVDPDGQPITQGFKESYLRHFQSQGNTVVYVGDGLSDQVAAKEADFVIARSSLADYLEANDVPHYTFETFSDVGKHVQEIMEMQGESRTQS